MDGIWRWNEDDIMPHLNYSTYPRSAFCIFAIGITVYSSEKYIDHIVGSRQGL